MCRVPAEENGHPSTLDARCHPACPHRHRRPPRLRAFSQKRADLSNKAIRIRDLLIEIKNGMGALQGARDGSSHGRSGRGDATPEAGSSIWARRAYTAILDELREAPRPMTSLQIAQAIVAVGGQDALDRKLISEVTRRAQRRSVS